jgi:hypothetical protein
MARAIFCYIEFCCEYTFSYFPIDFDSKEYMTVALSNRNFLAIGISEYQTSDPGIRKTIRLLNIGLSSQFIRLSDTELA